MGISTIPGALKTPSQQAGLAALGHGETEVQHPMESPFQWLENAVPGKVGPDMPCPEPSSVAPHTPVLSRAPVVGDNPMNIL